MSEPILISGPFEGTIHIIPELIQSSWGARRGPVEKAVRRQLDGKESILFTFLVYGIKHNCLLDDVGPDGAYIGRSKAYLYVKEVGDSEITCNVYHGLTETFMEGSWSFGNSGKCAIYVKIRGLL